MFVERFFVILPLHGEGVARSATDGVSAPLIRNSTAVTPTPNPAPQGRGEFAPLEFQP